jgi:hypothetical protein
MGIFKKTDDERLEFRKKTEERVKNTQDKTEAKVREKARKAGIDVDRALYIFTCLHDKDDKSIGSVLAPIFGIIYQDKVVKSQKRMTGTASEVIPVKNISSVEVSNGLLKTVTIYATGNVITFKVGVEAQKIADIVRSLITSGGQTNGSLDPVSQVEKLAGLLDRGLLTKSEFEKKKKEILGL